MRTMGIAGLLSLALLTGCAGGGQNVKFSEEHRITLTTQPVHAVHLEPLGFQVESEGYTAAFFFLGPLVAIGQAAEGSDLRTGLRLEDPAVRVKERLLAALEEPYRLPNLVRVAQPAGRFAPDTKYSALSGLILEVRTTHWGIDNNRAKYAAGVRVLRLSDGAILWDAACDPVIADKHYYPLTLEQLRADNGALLKAKLNLAADECAHQLAAWALERAEKR